jgi:acetolactate synthase I/II/III large subunit
MSDFNGGHLLSEVLQDHGVDTVFGVVSVHNLPLVEAVAQRLRFVPVRHEATAVNAADGYGRARDGIGCALTSTGTGAGNAAGSLIEALSAGAPLLHVTGQVELRHLGTGRGFIHETKDQLGMLQAVSKHALTIRGTDHAERILRSAIATATCSPGGPVSVEWPIDLQYATHPRQHAAPASHSTTPSTARIADAVALLTQARRPVIWAGGGGTRCGDLVQQLVERLNAPLLTSNSGRGSIPEDHPLCVGNYATTPGVQELLDDADLLLSLGTHFRSNETADYRLRVPATHIQVDIDPAAIGRVYPAKVGVVGDTAHVLHALLTQLTGTDVEPTWGARARQVREEVRTRQRQAIGPHAALCDAVRTALPRDAVIARDVTIASSSWGNRLLPIYHPRTNIFPRGGGIGQGLGMGIGAALAQPDAPTLAMVGDGGLAVHLGDILTLTHERPWLVLLVFNDEGYGVLRNMQDAHGGQRAGVDLATPDFATLAEAVHLPYRRISCADEAESVLRDAVTMRSPVVVEVDLAAYGDMPQPFTPPVHVPSGSHSDGEEGQR